MVTASNSLKKRIRVTLVFPAIPPIRENPGERDVHTTRTWDIKAPARDFEGEISYYISEHGNLTIHRLESGGMGRVEPFITYAHGQWLCVEVLPLSVDTKQGGN